MLMEDHLVCDDWPLACCVNAAFCVTLTGVLEQDAAPGSMAGVGLFHEPWQRQL